MEICVLSPAGKQTLAFSQEETISEVLHRSGIHLTTPCGARGLCGKCTVSLLEGNQENTVLACRTKAADGMVVRIDNQERLSVYAPLNSKVYPVDQEMSGWGVACDIGTTTIACSLISLSTGEVCATLGEDNKQRSYGDDVISRIYASMEGHLEGLTDEVCHQLSHMINALCVQAGASLSEVRQMSVAGNTIMCHLLTGLPPDSIGKAPFTPLSLFGQSYPAERFHLPFAGDVYIAPAVSGYIGGDIVADLLAVNADHAEMPILLVDVGTNGEMVLGQGDTFFCCSTAAGPAFEGAQISQGMTASKGAVSSVEWENESLEVSVIGGGKAVGICGSGLIDAIAVMLELGVLDETGRLLDPDEDDVPPRGKKFLVKKNGKMVFQLTNDVAVTQSDVRKLQLGRGAIAAGIQILIKKAEENFEGIGALLLAGGFGSYIRPQSAARIGMIPEEFLPITRAVGNAAAEGACMSLLSRSARKRMAKLRDSMHYIELSYLDEFCTAYMDAMYF